MGYFLFWLHAMYFQNKRVLGVNPFWWLLKKRVNPVWWNKMVTSILVNPFWWNKRVTYLFSRRCLTSLRASFFRNKWMPSRSWEVTSPSWSAVAKGMENSTLTRPWMTEPLPWNWTVPP